MSSVSFFLDFALRRLIKSSKIFRKSHFKVYSRRSTIVPFMVNKIAQIYNGKKFIQLRVQPDMIGSKFGEFSLTKKMGYGIHNSKRNQKRKNRAKKR